MHLAADPQKNVSSAARYSSVSWYTYPIFEYNFLLFFVNIQIPLWKLFQMMPSLYHVLDALRRKIKYKWMLLELTVSCHCSCLRGRPANSRQGATSKYDSGQKRDKISRLFDQLDALKTNCIQLRPHLSTAQVAFAAKEEKLSAFVADYYRLAHGRKRRDSNFD